ncbi:hypothetical protein BGW38_005113 [Lunasporangiospora selenospora]|uniref:F-box domain-containing protein n=1 Tax=Lunasporangiospora selenospora TaxID=979761 RepID=A0A9P6KBK7_9FUNG|nr:hypothetical protein BGW38_005113 [Lunasporangiospora selenospora]
MDPVVLLAPCAQSPCSLFVLPELDRFVAKYLDQATLARAARVSKLWNSVFMPELWKQLSLSHHTDDDDDIDDDCSIFSRASPPTSLPSLPSSCSSTWSNSSLTMSPPGLMPLIIEKSIPKLSWSQRAFIRSSQNKKLWGLLRHGQMVQELTATGLTDQEIDLIRICCPNLRILELIGGRYSIETLSDLFGGPCQSTLQTVRFRSCMVLKDIFKPLALLTNMREFELHGSFVGNTITSPHFFERELFPVLAACPSLRTIHMAQVYIVDQEIDHDEDDEDESSHWDGKHQKHPFQNSRPGSNRDSNDARSSIPLLAFSSVRTTTADPSISILSAQLKARLNPTGMFRPLAPPNSLNSASIMRLPLRSPLKRLTLDCGDIPESVIMSLLKRCPLLEELSLDASRTLTDTSLSRLHRLCPNVIRISLNGCEAATARGLISLFHNYPNLVSVSLKDNLLSDEALAHLARSCRLLQSLNINDCRGVTELGIQEIFKHCAMLSFFSLRMVPMLSYFIFDEILAKAISAASPCSGSQGSAMDRINRVVMHGATGTWACRHSLESLHLPDLCVPMRAVTDKYLQFSAHQRDGAQPLKSNQVIQRFLEQLTRIKHLTIGGSSLDFNIFLQDLGHTPALETLRITRLGQPLNAEDVQRFVETVVPHLRTLIVPSFGSFLAKSWITEHRPDLL